MTLTSGVAHTPVMPLLKKQRLKGPKFKARTGNIVRYCRKKMGLGERREGRRRKITIAPWPL